MNTLPMRTYGKPDIAPQILLTCCCALSLFPFYKKLPEIWSYTLYVVEVGSNTLKREVVNSGIGTKHHSIANKHPNDYYLVNLMVK